MSKHVLVTRPSGQQQSLVASLVQAGFEVSHSPALSIEGGTLSALERGYLANIDHYHAVIFISRNAAKYALEYLRDYWPQWPAGVHWLAVGEATAAVLEGAGMLPDHPEQGFSSESLLGMPCLQDLNDKKVLLLRGEGGREVLAPALRERAERFDEVVLYRRACAAQFAWPDKPIDVLMVTSQQGWECIADKVPQNCSVIAGSERIAGLIRQSGFSVTAARSPHDGDMLAALKHFS